MIIFTDKDTAEISELIFSKHKIDFRNYAKSSLSRRFSRFMSLHSITTKEAFVSFIDQLSDVNSFVEEITVNTTEMFRDPGFWIALREQVLPILSSYENIKIWHAGCSTGEEVVSMQILLTEMGLKNKVSAYATDLDSTVLEKAKKLTYPKKNFALNEANYKEAKGQYSLEKYIRESNDFTYSFQEELIENVTFKKNDLVKELMYTKFDLILCRNVLIYFDFELQEKVFKKFITNLFSSGFVAIGQKELILSNDILADLSLFHTTEKIYRYNK